MPNALKKRISQAGLTVFGGALGTGMVAGGIFLNMLGTTGTVQKNDVFPAFVPVVIDVAATGATASTNRYDAVCKSLGELMPGIGTGAFIGTGAVALAEVHNITNPNGAGGDLGFVMNCNDQTASGDDLINNTCTASACVARYTTGTANWNGDMKLKYTLRKDPTSGYDAKIVLWIKDVLGE